MRRWLNGYSVAKIVLIEKNNSRRGLLENFFPRKYLFYFFSNEHSNYCSSSRILATIHSTMVKHHWHSLVLLISGILLRFYLNMVLLWTWLVGYMYDETLAIFRLSFRWTAMETLYYIYLSFIVDQRSTPNSKNTGDKT